MKTRTLSLAVVAALLATTGVASAETRKFSGTLEPTGKISFTFKLKRDKNKKIIRSSRRVSKVKIKGLSLRFCDETPGRLISATLPGKFKFEGPSFRGAASVGGFQWDISGPIFSKATKAQGSVTARSGSCYGTSSFTAKKKR